MRSSRAQRRTGAQVSCGGMQRTHSWVVASVLLLGLHVHTATSADWATISQSLDAGGQILADWSNANNPCGNPPFTGVICNRTVPAAINLSGMELTGNIPNEILQLNTITSLDLSNNKLSGGIPPAFAQMVALQSLDLSNNVLNGQIAFDWTPMVALSQLVIFNNYLTGGLPPSWGNLRRMAVLEAQSNQFQGGIPGALENMRNLVTLRLDRNQLTGTPPAGLIYLRDKPGATYNFSNQANAQAFSCQPFALCAGTNAGGAVNLGDTPAARPPTVAPGSDPGTGPTTVPGGEGQSPTGAPGGTGGSGNGSQVLPGEQGSPPGSNSSAQNGNGNNSSTGADAPAPDSPGSEVASGSVPPSSSSKTSLPLPVIIGAAAGGAAILAVLALIIGCLCCRKRAKEDLPVDSKTGLPVKRTLSMTGHVKRDSDIEALGGSSLLANAAPMPGPSPEPSPLKIAAVEGAAAGAAAAATAATVKYQQNKEGNGFVGSSAENSWQAAPHSMGKNEVAAKGGRVGAELRGDTGLGTSRASTGGAPMQSSILSPPAPPPGYPATPHSTAGMSINDKVIMAGSAVAAGTAVGVGVAAASSRRRESPRAPPKDEPLWEAPPPPPMLSIPSYSGSPPKQADSYSTLSSTSVSEVSEAPVSKITPPQPVPPPAPIQSQPPIRILPPQKLPPIIPEDKATTESDFADSAQAGNDVDSSDVESLLSSRDNSRSSAYDRERAAAASLAAAQLVAGINAATGAKKPAAAETASKGMEKASASGAGYGAVGKGREEEEEDEQEEDGEWEASGGESLQRFFTVQELSLATNDFGRQAKRNILGTGRFGTVYKARLPDGTTVAVKKLTNQNPDQTAREFKFEAEAFVAARHPNLVGLLGCCAEDKERMLVYEFVPNGSLEQWLHTGPGAESLDWPMRMHLALGTARGLFHLHQGMEMKVVHRDVKSSNVLIDAQWNGKLGDFALAKIMGREQAVAATRVVGTFGYAAPEYMNTGLLTERSDVYSFGVLLLEVFTGRKPIDNTAADGERELVPFVQRLADEGRLMDALDPRLQGMVPPEDVEYVMGIALKCVDRNALKRPRMSQIVAMLESEDPANRTDWMPRRPSVQNTPRTARDNSPSITPSGRDATPSYRGAYDHPYYSPRVNNLVSPRVRDSATGANLVSPRVRDAATGASLVSPRVRDAATGAYVSASPRVRDSASGAGYVGVSPRLRDPATGYVSYSPRVRDPAVGYSPRANGNVAGAGYVGSSPRVRDGAQYLPRAGSPRAASPTAADIITSNAMNVNAKKQWSSKR